MDLVEIMVTKENVINYILFRPKKSQWIKSCYKLYKKKYVSKNNFNKFKMKMAKLFMVNSVEKSDQQIKLM